MEAVALKTYTIKPIFTLFMKYKTETKLPYRDENHRISFPHVFKHFVLFLDVNKHLN